MWPDISSDRDQTSLLKNPLKTLIPGMTQNLQKSADPQKTLIPSLIAVYYSVVWSDSDVSMISGGVLEDARLLTTVYMYNCSISITDNIMCISQTKKNPFCLIHVDRGISSWQSEYLFNWAITELSGHTRCTITLYIQELFGTYAAKQPLLQLLLLSYYRIVVWSKLFSSIKSLFWSKHNAIVMVIVTTIADHQVDSNSK